MNAFVRNISHYWEINTIVPDADVTKYGTPRATKVWIKGAFVPNGIPETPVVEEPMFDFGTSFRQVWGFESPLTAAMRLKNFAKLDTELQRKVQSVDCRVGIGEPGQARIQLKDLTVSEADNPQLGLGNVLEIRMGHFNWWAFGKFSRPLFQGAIKERQIAYEDSGIQLTIVLMGVPSLNMSKEFRYPLFYPGDGVESIEEAFQVMSDYLGVSIYLKATNLLDLTKHELSVVSNLKDVEFNKIAKKTYYLASRKITYDEDNIYLDAITTYKKKEWQDYFWGANTNIVLEKNGKKNRVKVDKLTPEGWFRFIADKYQLRFFMEGNAIFLEPTKPMDLMTEKISKFFYYRRMKEGNIPFLETIQIKPTEDTNGDIFTKFEALENYGNTGGNEGLSYDPDTKKGMTKSQKTLMYATTAFKGGQMKGIAVHEYKKVITELNKVLSVKSKQEQADYMAKHCYADTVVLENGKTATLKQLQENPDIYQGKYGTGRAPGMFCRISGCTGDVNFKLTDKFVFKGCIAHTGIYAAQAIEYIFDNSKSFTMNIIGRRYLDLQPTLEELKVKKEEKTPDGGTGKIYYCIEYKPTPMLDIAKVTGFQDIFNTWIGVHGTFEEREAATEKLRKLKTDSGKMLYQMKGVKKSGTDEVKANLGNVKPKGVK